MRTKSQLIVVRLEESLKQKLGAVAYAQQMTLSEVIRAALEDYCAPDPNRPVLVPIVGTISGHGIVFDPGKGVID